MKKDNVQKFLDDGFFILKDCIENKLINKINATIKNEIINLLKQKKIKGKKDFHSNYLKLKKVIPKNIIQIKLGETL